MRAAATTTTARWGVGIQGLGADDSSYQTSGLFFSARFAPVRRLTVTAGARLSCPFRLLDPGRFQGRRRPFPKAAIRSGPRSSTR